MPLFQILLPQGPGIPANTNLRLEESLTRHFGRNSGYKLVTEQKVIYTPPFVLSFESALKRTLDDVGLRESARDEDAEIAEAGRTGVSIITELKVA